MISLASLPERPALRSWCRVVRDDGRYLVEHRGSVVTLEGRAASTLLPELLPMLDGTRTISELTTELGPAAAPAIEQVLTVLAANRLLDDGVVAGRRQGRTAAAVYGATVTSRTSGAEAADALGAARVDVHGTGSVARQLVRLTRASGIETRAVRWGAVTARDAFVVAVPDASELDRLEHVNRWALETGQAWLQVLPFDGRFTIVGPLFLPHQSACRTCYVLRRAACSGYENDHDRVEATPVRAVAPAPLAAVAAGIAGLLALRWLTTRDPTLPGRMYAYESAVVMRLAYELVLRVPRCPACSSDTAVPSPWFELSS